MSTITGEDTTASEATTIERTGRHRHSTMTVFISVVVAALVGFGLGWLAFGDSGTDVPSEVEELVDAYVAAWNETDGDAAVALLGGDGVHYSGNDEGVSGDELAVAIDNLPATDQFTDFEIESVSGDNPWLVVSSGSAFGRDGYSVFHIEEVAGEYTILIHHWFD